MSDIFPPAPDTMESLATQHNYSALIQHVSHELRSTFGVISGLHSLLPLAADEAERDDLFARLHNNTEYATQLFTDLEDYCAMETGNVRAEPTPFRPAAALEYVRKKALPMLQRRKAAVVLSGDSETLVDSDEEKIQRILKNIVFHLTCVMRVQRIEMGWEKRATIWTLNVAYHGEALPEWLFMPENEPYDSGIGRHISLLVVRRLVSLLGGVISGGKSGADGLRRVSFQFPH